MRQKVEKAGAGGGRGTAVPASVPNTACNLCTEWAGSQVENGGNGREGFPAE